MKTDMEIGVLAKYSISDLDLNKHRPQCQNMNHPLN